MLNKGDKEKFFRLDTTGSLYRESTMTIDKGFMLAVQASLGNVTELTEAEYKIEQGG